MIGLIIGVLASALSLVMLEAPPLVAFSHGALAALVIYVVQSLPKLWGHLKFVGLCIADGRQDGQTFPEYLGFVAFMAVIRLGLGMVQPILFVTGTVLLYSSVTLIGGVQDLNLWLLIPGCLLIGLGLIKEFRRRGKTLIV